MKVLAQKLSEPPASPPGNAQQWLSLGSVQSVFVVQRRTMFVPEHEKLIVVVHALAAVHAVVTGSVVQLVPLPPVMGIVPQQMGVEPEQFAGAVHPPAS